MQVEKCFDWLMDNAAAVERHVRFLVTCGVGSDRGVYLREPHQILKPKELQITVEPSFLDLHSGIAMITNDK